MRDLIERLSRARVFDLSQPLHHGVPHFPTHPPFSFTLTKLHGEIVLANGASSAADAISLGTHNGTHIDALNHFSCCGMVYGGEPVAERQSYAGGVEVLGVDGIAPVFRRGVLLDIATLEGQQELREDFEIAPEHLERAAAGTAIAPGDIVLIRTGWGRRWSDPKSYVNGIRMPGVKRAGAEWLSERRVFAAGSDTLAFEFMPSPEMEAHVHLLVESGIHIIENLALEGLAAAGVREVLFTASPLPIRGATGSPVRALGLVEERS